MVIFKDLTFQTRSDVPNRDWTGGEARFVVADNSALADKIMAATFGFEPIVGDAGELVDVVVLGAPDDD
jgi:hypothetical protein